MTRPVSGRTDQDFRDQVGDVPRMAAVPTPFGYESRPQIAAGPGGRTTKSTARLNLRPVIEILDGYGLDPHEEIAKVLVREDPVLDAQGNPVINPKTGEPLTKPALPIDVRLRTLLELAQYTRAKLKAVEHTLKPPELTDDQIDARLKALVPGRSNP